MLGLGLDVTFTDLYKRTYTVTPNTTSNCGNAKALQYMLNALGYVGADGKPLAVDGVFGTNAWAAMKKFSAYISSPTIAWIAA